MKVIYLTVTYFFIMFTTSSCYCQLLEYQKVISAQGLKPSVIIERANRWAAISYNSYKDVLQFKDSTTLVVNGATQVDIESGHNATFSLTKSNINYQLQIEAKADRFKITISNFYGKTNEGKYDLPNREGAIQILNGSKYLNNTQKKSWIISENKRYDQLDSHAQKIFSELDKLMAPGKDDW